MDLDYEPNQLRYLIIFGYCIVHLEILYAV